MQATVNKSSTNAARLLLRQILLYLAGHVHPKEPTHGSKGGSSGKYSPVIHAYADGESCCCYCTAEGACNSLFHAASNWTGGLTVPSLFFPSQKAGPPKRRTA